MNDRIAEFLKGGNDRLLLLLPKVVIVEGRSQDGDQLGEFVV